MQHTFTTEGPVSLYVELHAGELATTTTDTAETTIHVDGSRADEVVVEQRGEQIVVIAPRQHGGLFRSPDEIRVSVTLPTASHLTTRLGSADLRADGRYGAVQVRSGSGDVRVEETTDPSSLESGSGDVVIGAAHAALRIKSGSGDVSVDQLAADASVSTGSGDVALGTSTHSAVVKTGSGDVLVQDAGTDLSLTTASGDLTVRRFRAGELATTGVSGDVHVGVPAGVPVWTDVSSLTGSIHSTLEGAGQPEEGEQFIALRATTVSGDIRLEQL